MLVQLRQAKSIGLYFGYPTVDLFGSSLGYVYLLNSPQHGPVPLMLGPLCTKTPYEDRLSICLSEINVLRLKLLSTNRNILEL